MSAQSQRRQRGISLIEILVAIVVLSIGLLGLAGLQANSLRTSQSALYRSQAAAYAEDMAERMRANLGGARTYDIALGDSAPVGTSIADRDRAEWLARLATLPGGAGSIAVDALNRTVTITVQWDDSRAGGPADANYTLVTRIWNTND
jgi:type IV pilus assembly protein PilV